MPSTVEMTEREWDLTLDPSVMLTYVQDHFSDRKMRLLACGCCRNIWEHLTDERSRHAIEVSERYADKLATPKELGKARGAALTVNSSEAWAAYWAANTKLHDPLVNVFQAAVAAPVVKATKSTGKALTWDVVQAQSIREQVALIREVIGNPFRDHWLTPSVLAWESGLVEQLAEGIYEEQAFERMPYLGDALEDAGCADDFILDHCRHGGPHLRGCWVLDLVLGKE